MSNLTLPEGNKNLTRFKSGPASITVLLLILAISLSFAGKLTQSYFASMDKRFFDHISNRFTQSGYSHLVHTRQLLLNHAKQLPVNDTSTLRFINDLFNRIPQVEDIVQWGITDYWASPAEFVAGNGGDCEDFVIAKYFALREIGIPAETMRLTYVKSYQAGKIENHMVLAYYPTAAAEPWIMDNIQPQMQLASKRPDLMPIYEFNGELTDKFSGPAMRKWGALLDRLNKEFAR